MEGERRPKLETRQWNDPYAEYGVYDYGTRG